jgi:LDH2 family malate/lactate/ureidoglycolate dehydrogenase
MVMTAGTNAFRMIAPWGGTQVKLGNNPLAFGAPCRNEPHFILDIAMSVGARGKIRAAQERGEAIPAGWALDSRGQPTTDPLEALKGFVMPIGGHKGYGLALMVDILSGVLTGALFGSDARSLFQDKSDPQGLGHFFIVIDPARFMDIGDFHDRMERLGRDMRSAPAADPERPVVLPGEFEHKAAAERSARGIPVEATLMRQLEALARGEIVAEKAAY